MLELTLILNFISDVKLIYRKLEFMEIIESPEFEALFYKVAMNKLDLKYLDEVWALCSNRVGQEELDNLTIRAKNLISLMYYMNGFSEKSLEMDLEMMSQFSDELLIKYYTLIAGAIITGAELGRTDEVRPFALRYLINKKTDHWDCLVIVLVWYIKHYPDAPEVSEKFEKVFSRVSSTIGYLSESSGSFADRVSSLSEVLIINHKNMDLFNRAYFKAAQENKEKILSDYLNENPLPIFREMVLSMVKNNP